MSGDGRGNAAPARVSDSPARANRFDERLVPERPRRDQPSRVARGADRDLAPRAGPRATARSLRPGSTTSSRLFTHDRAARSGINGARAGRKMTRSTRMNAAAPRRVPLRQSWPCSSATLGVLRLPHLLLLRVYISRTFYPGDNPSTALLATLATFGAGFLTRPIGAIVIGRMGDRIGRKPPCSFRSP